ncbi:patatin-like phospholipase family protein [Sphingomonas sp. S2-65]|uniref:patatin-like phospholipase family protein n=1 Tax=Sphingomonas sp. S2-65 TaxID=2903960 RepID=UPI001F474071|nr:patatin-like phospholipase family protein [Sphingomonas sp. S2-65]UYY58212.1 patatin-like phospholipase family protein [Sphingomonas sp. S2-65]
MPTGTALILGGGVGLGAYQLGAYAALEASGAIELQAVAGSSIGAINGAILAGNPPEQRLPRLRSFWKRVEREAAPDEWVDPLALARTGPLRHLRNWGNILATRTTGTPGLFQPRLPGMGRSRVPSLYDAGPLAESLTELVDFDLLNQGPVRFAIATTDVETGETILFDTALGDRITPDHILASSALLPAFEPVQIDGRWLGDGGFSANVPLEPVLCSERPCPAPPLCVILDLFPPDGPLPVGLEATVERATDLKFATQTTLRLAGLRRERALEARLESAEASTVLHLSYRGPAHEAGQEKTYDFSPATLRDREQSGADDAQAALALLRTLPEESAPGLHIHRVRRP